MTHAVRHVCTRHRGDTEKAFIECVLRRNRGTFPEGGTLQKRNLGRAVQRNHSGLAMLEESVLGG